MMLREKLSVISMHESIFAKTLNRSYFFFEHLYAPVADISWQLVNPGIKFIKEKQILRSKKPSEFGTEIVYKFIFHRSFGAEYVGVDAKNIWSFKQRRGVELQDPNSIFR